MVSLLADHYAWLWIQWVVIGHTHASWKRNAMKCKHQVIDEE